MGANLVNVVDVDEERRHVRTGRMGRRSWNGLAPAGVQQVGLHTDFTIQIYLNFH